MVPVWIWQSLSLEMHLFALHSFSLHRYFWLHENINIWYWRKVIINCIGFQWLFLEYLAIIYNILKMLSQSCALLDRAETLLVHSWFHHHWILNHKLRFQTALVDRQRFSISNSKWRGGGGHFTLMTLLSLHAKRTNLGLTWG